MIKLNTVNMTKEEREFERIQLQAKHYLFPIESERDRKGLLSRAPGDK